MARRTCSRPSTSAPARCSGECKPNRNGATFLTFLKGAVKPHTGKEIHVVLDNLSTHTTPEVNAWLSKNPHIHFHFTPVGSSWLKQIEIWFGILTRQSIRRGTFSSVNILVKQIRDYINAWNQQAKPFTWTAIARGSGKGPTRPDQREETRQQQHELTQTESRGTSYGLALPGDAEGCWKPPPF
ncbi:transposase [Streptomyces celluloflavus]|uniref:transposase n=1 Tax=Streptomyces celluloflavus TaxID=58344 RepID=UPI00368CF133